MGYSPLVEYIRISKNKTILPKKELERVSIHSYVGQVTAKQGVDYFATTSVPCSSNYVIGKDGDIGLSVDEKDRSWCTSSKANDEIAITIEVACERKAPYEVTEKAFAAIIDLLADICRRHNKNKVIWIPDKTKALRYRPAANELLLTVHRWFANKSCPGDYLYNKHGLIAAAVNNILNADKEEEEEMTQEKFNEMMDTYIANLNSLPVTFEQEAIDWAETKGLVLGNEKGEPMAKRYITRGELVVILKRYHDKYHKG